MGPGRGVCTSEPCTLRLWVTLRCQGQERRKNCWLEEKRRGRAPLATVPSPAGKKVPQCSLPFPWPGDVHAGQWQPPAAQGNRRTGPHPRNKCRAGQLKQADKGRTIPDLKNARNYLPRGGSSGPLWEGQCRGTRPDNPQGCWSAVQRTGRGSLTRTRGHTCLPDRLASCRHWSSPSGVSRLISNLLLSPLVSARAAATEHRRRGPEQQPCPCHSSQGWCSELGVAAGLGSGRTVFLAGRRPPAGVFSCGRALIPIMQLHSHPFR